MFIESKKGHKINSILNYAGSKSDKLNILVHGLGHSPDIPLHYNAKDFFVPKGIDVLRVFLYSDERPLSNLSVNDSVEDLNEVIENMREVYSNINLVGHSLGAYISIKSNLDLVDSLVLWDPFVEVSKSIMDKASYDDKLNKYVLKWPIESLLSVDMHKQISNMSVDELVNISKPFKLILAENSFLSQDYLEKLVKNNVDFKDYLIKGASHSFVEDGKLAELYKETLSWINRH